MFNFLCRKKQKREEIVQRDENEVLTELIKVNFPAKFSYNINDILAIDDIKKLEELQSDIRLEIDKDQEVVLNIKKNSSSYESPYDLIEAYEKVILAKKNYLEALSLRVFALRGPRSDEFAIELGSLVKENTTFWKFSQSEKGKSYEDVFIEYVPGKITEAEDKSQGISFVMAYNLYKCYMYGDQISEFVFDFEDEQFKTIANSKAHRTGNGLGEFKADYLLTKNNYSLSFPETIVKILKLSRDIPGASTEEMQNNMYNAANTIFRIPAFTEILEKFRFDDTINFITYCNNVSSDKEEPVVWIAENIDELLKEYTNSKNAS